MFHRSTPNGSNSSSEEMSSSRLNMLQVEPLDEQEQQVVIDQLKEEARRQVEGNRQLFSTVFTVIAVIFAFCALYTMYYPWTIEHQRHFKELLPSWAFLAYYAGSAFCFLVAGMVAKEPHKSPFVGTARTLAFVVGIIVLMGWGHVFYKHQVSNPVLFWLPMADLAGLLLAQYVDFDSNGLILNVEGLEKFKYNYKAA